MIRRTLFVIGLLLYTTYSQAAILSLCAEDINCTFQGTVAISTTAGTFDATYARYTMIPALNNTTSVPPPNRIVMPTFSSASSDFWVSVQYYSNGFPTNNHTFIMLSDGGVQRLLLRGSGTVQQPKLSTRNAAGTIVDLATATGSTCAAATVLCKLDIHVVYAVAGSVNVYSNGVNILSYSGDVTTDGATTLDSAEFANTTNATNSARWSELLVADVDTRSLRVLSCVPQAAGTPQDWSGAAVGNINEATINDANFNSTANNNERSNWTLCTLPAGVQTIVNVHTCSRLSRGASGPQSARHSLEAGGNQYDNGSDLTLNTSFGNFCYNWGGTSPDSGVGWTPAEFSTMETGVLSKP